MMGGGLSVSTADTKQVSSIVVKQKRWFIITLTLSGVGSVVFFSLIKVALMLIKDLVVMSEVISEGFSFLVRTCVF